MGGVDRSRSLAGIYYWVGPLYGELPYSDEEFTKARCNRVGRQARVTKAFGQRYEGLVSQDYQGGV